MPERLPERPPKVCETCGGVLSYFTHPDGGGGYGHARQVLADNEDHVPIPVDPTPENMRIVCDVCSTPVTMAESWTLHCKPLAMQVGDTLFDQSSLWALCEPCTEIVKERKWGQLARRAIEVHEHKEPPESEQHRDVRRELHRQIVWALRQNFLDLRPSDFDRDVFIDDIRAL